MNTLSIILLEVQWWVAILTLFGALIGVILFENELYDHFFGNLWKTCKEKLRHKKQTKMKNIDMNCKINGKEYELPSHASISIRDGVVYVDNKKYIDTTTEFANDHIINIEVCGNVEQIASGSGTVIVHGNANFVQSSSGDIEVNADVRGNVQSSSGDITCENVGGDVRSVSGDINCGNVSGETHTKSGDIYHNKQKMKEFEDHN